MVLCNAAMEDGQRHFFAGDHCPPRREARLKKFQLWLLRVTSSTDVNHDEKCPKVEGLSCQQKGKNHRHTSPYNTIISFNFSTFEGQLENFEPKTWPTAHGAWHL